MSLVQEAWISQEFASEPWAEDATLYKPIEEQVLINDNAAALAVQAYLHMCQLKIEVITVPNADFIAPSGKIPVLHCGKFIISEPLPIMNFIKHKGMSLAKDLNDKDKHDLIAYGDLVNNVLVPAELFVTWLHKETCDKITYKRYGHSFPWPLNHLLCWQKRRNVQSYLSSLGWGKNRCSLARAEEEVNRCCQALSNKLGSKLYFYGNKPTELDALVFGHLYTLLTTKLPDNRLAETVKSFENLVKFCENIDKTYFSKEFVDEGTQSESGCGDG